MPLFTRPKWQGYTFYARPTDSDFWRTLDVFRLLPYFWDSPVCFDLSVRPPYERRKDTDTNWSYEWQLCGLDDTPISNGFGEIQIKQKSVKRTGWSENIRAFYFGYLKPHQQYRLKIRVHSSEIGKSDYLTIAAFTIKDRDDYYIQILILLVALGFSAILWILGG